MRSHSKRPKRVDVTKLPPTDLDNGPPNKIARNNAGPGIIRGELDPNSSDHVVAMTQLKEQIASLQKQINQRDGQLLSKDKMVSIFFFYWVFGFAVEYSTRALISRLLEICLLIFLCRVCWMNNDEIVLFCFFAEISDNWIKSETLHDGNRNAQ